MGQTIPVDVLILLISIILSRNDKDAHDQFLLQSLRFVYQRAG